MFKSQKPSGFSLVEVILSVGLAILIVLGVSTAILYGEDSVVRQRDQVQGVLYAEEALEAVRNIRDENFTNLADGTYGLGISSAKWALVGSSDVSGSYSRQINISTPASGIKRISVTVTWNGGSHTAVTDLTNWTAISPLIKGGMVVYANGGVLTDSILFRKVDGGGTWTTAASVADVDALTATKVPVSVGLYSSSTRNEKILISRHINSLLTTQNTIYAQVFNGTSWGNVIQLATWTATTASEYEKFSGTYLSNGNFMAVFSDNTNALKFRTWNGTAWSAQVSLQNQTAVPNYIVAKNRPNTNEVMVANFDAANDVYTQYFNGGTFTTANWTLHARHSTNAPALNKRLVDFEWSNIDATKGGLVFTNNASEKSINGRVWTANGSGSGAWTATTLATAQATNLGSLSITSSKTMAGFNACSKNLTPAIICYNLSSTGLWTNPTNQTIAATADAGIQRSFHNQFEGVSGNPGVIVYSDNSSTPKLKKYTTTSTTWDSSVTSLTALSATLETVSLIERTDSDDIMILLGDNNNDLYSIAWNGTSNAVYATGGFGLTMHGTNGVATTAFWYDFAWDKF